jgi:peptidoglycan/xylan/chitin deacetylase (PgdA/CDA1 family)
LKHFQIDLSRIRSIALSWFRNFNTVQIKSIALVNGVPSNVRGIQNLNRTPLVSQCIVPNSVAFGIDNGDPKLAQRVLELLDQSNIKATLFPLGVTLYNTSNNLTLFYLDAIQKGHEVGLHSWSHPVLSQAPDWEVERQVGETVKAVQELLGIQAIQFRPPYGAIDARLQNILFNQGLKAIMWSIDVKDYIYAGTPDFAKQLEAFENDLVNGGSIVVMHFLKADTVELIPQFVATARRYGKRIITIGECLGI